MNGDFLIVIQIVITIVSAADVTEDTAKILSDGSIDANRTNKTDLTSGEGAAYSGSNVVNLIGNDTDKNNSFITDCESHIAHCRTCREETRSLDQIHMFNKRQILTHMKSVDKGNLSHTEEEYLQMWLNMTDWKCLECDHDYRVSAELDKCISCKADNRHCAKCNESKWTMCILCEEGFCFNNMGMCISCNLWHTLEVGGCTSLVPNCDTCGIRYQNIPQRDVVQWLEFELDKHDRPADHSDEKYLQKWVDMPKWKCVRCIWGYTLSRDQSECVSCGSVITHCTECHNVDGRVRCSVCDKGFYIYNETTCRACDETIENCNTCEYEVTNLSKGLFCTGCKGGFYFDYYRNCSSCNETLPRCTRCSSFDTCKVFGPVQNLTCHSCEDDYYVDKDEISCKVDCRNISNLCGNCSTLAGKDECSACTTGAYLDIEGMCHNCTDRHANCRECTDVSSDIDTRCLSCDSGFVLQPGTHSCKECSVISHCSNCLLSSESDDGKVSTICIQCDLGFFLSNTKKECIDCSNAEEHCGNCHQNVDEELSCTACVPGYSLSEGKCEVTVCGLPPPPPHRGGYAFTGMASGDTVTYDCECGYDLIGKQTLTCGELGQWDQPPCCKRKMLGILMINLDHSGKMISDDDVLEILLNMKDINVAVLDVSRNRLGEVPCLTYFKQLDTLQSVKLYANEIETFVWDDFPAETKEIHLNNNKLRTLPGRATYHTCLSVVVLNLARNYLSSIKTDAIPHTVEKLSLAHNNIVQVDNLLHCKYLINVDLGNNRIATFPQKLPKCLQILCLYDNKLSVLSDIAYLEELKYLNLGQNKLNSILCGHFPRALTKLALNSNNISIINDFSCLKELQTLRLSNNNITKFPDHLSLDLEELDLRNNRISKLKNVTYLEKLSILYLNGNNLTSMPEHLPQNLTHLKVSGIIGDINVTYLYNLQILSMINCSLVNLSQSQLPASLRELNLADSYIGQLNNLSQMDNLTTLHLRHSNFTINLDLLPASLEDLSLLGNIILNWKGMWKFEYLKYLDLDLATLHLWPLKSLVNLTALQIHGKEDSYLMDLSCLTNITWVMLINFNFSSVPSNLPPNMAILHLYSCQLTDPTAPSQYKKLTDYHVV